jgi:peptide/nickel transport system substrate-binding protein
MTKSCWGRYVLWGLMVPCLLAGPVPGTFAEKGGQTKDRLVLCLSGPVETLDPTDYRDRETQIALKKIFESLTTRDRELNVRPLLAESFKTLNPREWEFRLKKGVLFHDGRELTARDVRYTFDRVIREGGIDGHTSVRKTLFGPLEGVTAIDDYTLRFVTSSPWPVLPLMMTLQEIVQEPYANASDAAYQPIGTGPFKFVLQNRDGSLELERFENYHDSAGKPKVRHLVIASEIDPVKRIAMIKRGKADIITQVPAETLTLLGINPEIQILSCPATRSYFADLNCKKSPFNDRRARVAVNNAMDMKNITRTVLQGNNQVLSTILLPHAFSFDRSLNPYPYAPEKAKALLKEAGVPDKTVLTVCCTRANETFAGAIAYYLNRLGLRSKIVVGERKAGIDAMQALTADILVTSWGNSSLDPVGIMIPTLKSKGAGNFSNYENPELDRLLDRAESTLDTDQRKALYMEAQHMIFDDAPMIFGYAAEEFYAARSYVHGFKPDMTGMIDIKDVIISVGDGL